MRIPYALCVLYVFFLMSAADTKTIDYPQSTEEANITYSEIQQEVLDRLGSNETFAYNVLVFYPAEKCEEYAVGGNMIRISGYENVLIYAVKFNPDRLDNQSLAEEWDHIQKKKDRLIEELYDQVAWRRDLWDADDMGLCMNLGTRSVAFSRSIRVLKTAAVFQCPRRFVWYELGWRYYEAFATTSDYVLRFDQSSPYDNNCGAVVFFPQLFRSTRAFPSVE